MSRKSWTVFWLAALLLLFVFNGSLLITDSVESNYALTAKEMVVSGDWLSPQIYGQYWFDKPVFFYWLTALLPVSFRPVLVWQVWGCLSGAQKNFLMIKLLFTVV